MGRLFFIALLFYPATLWAAEPEPINFFHSGLKVFLGLAVVVGIMLLFHVINRKGFKFLESRQASRIRIVETRPVGGRKSLCLVEVEGERLLLGLGNDRVDCLHHFDGEKAGGRFEKELEAQVEAGV